MSTPLELERIAYAVDRRIAAERATVAAQHPAAALAGVRVLATGGNVVDAAVAASFGAMVGDVGRTGVGGYGGHLLYHEAATGTTWLVDFPSRAPRAAEPGLFAAAEGPLEVARDPRLTGPLAVSVPAAVAGLAAAHHRFGRLPWRDVVAPAIELAEQGIRFPNPGRQQVHDQRARAAAFPETIRVFMDAWEDDRLRQPDLARSLRLIAQEGPGVLYRGALAEAIVAHVRALGGVLDADDLADCAPTIRSAYHLRYRGHDVLLAGPGSGAGVVAPVLGALEQFDVRAMAPLRAERVGLLAALFGRVWPDRLRLAGFAPDGSNAAERLLEPTYWSRVAADVRAGTRAHAIADDPGTHTNHLSVADTDGNVVACTTTLQVLLGSALTVPGTGIVLNSGMGLFDAQPGRPNSVAPGKTTVTNMCPTIVLRDGRPRLALGASGGRLIPSMVTQPATLVVDHDWPADRALAAPRLHHVGDGRLLFEEGLDEAAAEQLAARGFTVDPRPWGSPDLGGQSPAVWFDAGSLFGVPDPRRHGAAAAV